MGGGDSRPREDRSGEYEPREPDGQQGPITGSTSAEGDAVQTEISAYTREGNPDDDGPVPEFSRAGDDDEGDDNGGYDRLTEILSEDEDGDEEEREGDDEGDEEDDGDDEVDFEEVRERLGVDEDDREDPSERADDGEDRLREILSEDEDGEDSGDGDDSEAEDGEGSEGDRSDDDGDSEEGPETEVEPSQSRVRRMAAMATVWSGAQTGTAAVETGERRADRVAELVARRAEDEATNPEE